MTPSESTLQQTEWCGDDYAVMVRIAVQLERHADTARAVLETTQRMVHALERIANAMDRRPA